MSYLLDRKQKRKRWILATLLVFLFAILFYFRVQIFDGLGKAAFFISRPVLVLGNTGRGAWSSLKSFFVTKNSLNHEIENLKAQLDQQNAKISDYDLLLAENDSLKEILGRLPTGKNNKNKTVLASILAKPNVSAYDTLLIDTGEDEGLQMGDLVKALGNVPVGRVTEVNARGAKVILFSSSGEKLQAILPSAEGSKGNIFVELVGRGGNNFEMAVPRGVNLQQGEAISLPGVSGGVVATVETIISDPRDPFTKAILVSPVNIQEIKFLEVEI